MSSIICVSQLNRYLSSRIKEDNILSHILVRGEISNFTNHAKTGHFYFSVKDNEGSIRAIMYNNKTKLLNFVPYNGMNVILSCSVQIYERDGTCQLNVNDIQPDGLGALYIAVEQLRTRLDNEGLFLEENKKPIPLFPNKIGIVTSADGAALQDILNILDRRYRLASVTIYPTLVQGVNAPVAICKAIHSADNDSCDVIIIARGGGSYEDLMCFNNEDVVRTVATCKTPVISAIGHETDTTLCDLAADLRTPTPSAAAERAVTDVKDILSMLDEYQKRLYFAKNILIENKAKELDNKKKLLQSLSPVNKLEANRRLCVEKAKILTSAFNSVLSDKKSEMAIKAKMLEELYPLKIISRGYAVIYDDGKRITSVKQLKKDDIVSIGMSDGSAKAKIL